MTARDEALAAVHRLEAWQGSLVLLLLALALGWLARRVLFRRLQTLAGRTTSAWGDRIVSEARFEEDRIEIPFLQRVVHSAERSA